MSENEKFLTRLFSLTKSKNALSSPERFLQDRGLADTPDGISRRDSDIFFPDALSEADEVPNDSQRGGDNSDPVQTGDPAENANNNNLAAPSPSQPKEPNVMTQMVPFLFIPISIVIFALIMRVVAPQWCNRVLCLQLCCKSIEGSESDSK